MTTTGQNDPVPARATMRDWAGLAVLALPCILYSMDLTVLNLAVPQLTASMQPSALELLWIVDIYGFVLAGALIPMGVLGDRIGRRRLLMIGAAAFGLASILAAFSDGVWQLIVARALLGLAAATLAPSTLSLVTTMFRDPGQRTFAIGIWIASFSSGAALGPVLGGILLEHFWWGSVFLLNVPVMILLLAAAPCLLPEARSPEAGWTDLTSAGLSIVAVLACVLGVKLAAHAGLGPMVFAALVTGLAATACFVARQHRLTDPLIDIHLFRQPAFRAAITINMLGFFIAFGTFLLIAQYLQLVLGLSPLHAALWSAPSGLAFILAAVATPLLARHASPPRIAAAGLAIAAAGLSLMAIGEALGLTRLIAGYVVLSVGLAPVFTLATDFIVSAAPPDRTGAAAGVADQFGTRRRPGHCPARFRRGRDLFHEAPPRPRSRHPRTRDRRGSGNAGRRCRRQQVAARGSGRLATGACSGGLCRRVPRRGLCRCRYGADRGVGNLCPDAAPGAAGCVTSVAPPAEFHQPDHTTRRHHDRTSDRFPRGMARRAQAPSRT